MHSLIPLLQAGLTDRYRVERLLGEGGMAFVFAATDVRHDRQVALKVLRPEFTAMVGAERFLKEIQVTAQLQHPHILPLYDSGAVGELLYYVMPLVKGESLRQRLDRERLLPVDETLAIVRSVASALDYAHRQGVLHRDIKPENILLSDGQPLLADFGIALAVTAADAERLTGTGLSIGTPSYMSPEQASGERVLDARSDIYALGCVAYEMLSGEPPFTGPTLQAVFVATMSDDPRPIADRRPSVPMTVAIAIHRALARVPADRFASAAAFAAALEEVDAVPTVGRRSPARGPAFASFAVATLAVAGGIVLGAIAGRSTATTPDEAPRRWNIALPADAPVALEGSGPSSGWQTAIAVSPAGDRLAYVAPSGRTTMINIRPLDSDSVITLAGTEGAFHPFFSPDGKWIAFFSGSRLRKVAAAGGEPVTLGVIDRVAGASWIADDKMLVVQNEGFELHWISASGAVADSTMHLDTQFGTPDVLPGGEWAVGQFSSGQLALLSLTTGEQLAITKRGILPLDSVRQADLLFGASPRWIESGHLVYGTGDGVLAAMPFDARRRRVLGEPVQLLSGMRMEAGFGYAEFAVARNGTMVYIPGRNQLYVNTALVSADGRIDTLPFPRGFYTQPRISPDGTRLAVQARNEVGGWDVLLMHLTTGLRQRISVEGNYRAFPASWFPSGREMMLGVWDPVRFLMYGARIQSLETGVTSELQLAGASYITIAPDGRSFVFSDWRTGDLFIRDFGADSAATRIPARGYAASFSPDGKWLAWGGVDGGVSVSSVPPGGAVALVAERGQMPLWTPDGRAIVYRDGGRYLRLPVSVVAGRLVAGRPQLLAEGPFLATFAWNHDIHPDGRLVVLLRSAEREAHTLGVITGFPAAVERLVQASPTSR